MSEAISDETVRRALQTTRSSRGRKRPGVFRAYRAELVWHRAEVLDRDAEPSEPPSPVVGFDASPDQVVSDVRQPVPVRPAQPARDDDEDRREGTGHLCMGCEPLQGWRHVKGTARRTAQDLAPWRQALGAVHGPRATVIRVVGDNLNTPTPAAWSATFPPAEACRILRPLAFHDTPKHGRWLTRAAIECAVGSTPGLDRRLGNQALVRHAVAAWETQRNAAKATVDWRCTTAKARRKLTHLYP